MKKSVGPVQEQPPLRVAILVILSLLASVDLNAGEMDVLTICPAADGRVIVDSTNSGSLLCNIDGASHPEKT